jgi:hypothetical protein
LNPRSTVLPRHTPPNTPRPGGISVETIKDVLTTIGIVIGAIWTGYTFVVLHQRREAEAKLAQLELQVKNFPLNIDIATSASQLAGSRLLTVDAMLSNPGAGPLTLTFQDPVFRLARVHVQSRGSITPVGTGSPLLFLSSGGEEIPERRLLAKQHRHMPYAFFIKEPGLYLIQVSVTYKDENQPAMNPTLAFEQAMVRVD